ncbi:imelysin family protein [Taibaiella chishuiensis]|uniref:Putative iron-regulated protein n=1 Tax=Taibaiella chishuiensis TaxID=1434707 RepID=A0A2P8DA75_9BACT|nr:imelysin family protein [Taibaiella chishuiensis]PSK94113.1 putative iron-regulated protein [Taibaiella chishuiensis]
MKKYALLTLAGSALFAATLSSCSSDKKNPEPQVDFNTLKTQVLTDFVDVVANPLYLDFKNKATDLNAAVTLLASNPTQANLEAARNAWRAVRVIWEQSEGFLIGPVDDDSYDPYMDTWPTDHNAMDNLLNSGTPLTLDYLAGLNNPEDEAELTLRGFHPLEYLLWDTDGNRQASSFTAREKEYMVALAGDILNNVTKLQASWLPGDIYFGKELATPGTGSRYENKHDALSAIASALTDICAEVGDGKMVDPFNPADSTKTESPYSHNSIADFKNNIIGARNVYLCTYNNKTGKSLSDLVKANNASLDNEIRQRFDIAISSFDGITTTFEQAIYNQRSQVQNTLGALSSLKESVEGKLIPYIKQYVTD